MKSNENFQKHQYSRELPVIIDTTSREHVYISPHWHGSVEILYFDLGQWAVICDGNYFEVTGGDIFIVNSGQIHCIERLTGEGQSFCLQINSQFPGAARAFVNHIKDVPEMHNYFRNMLEEYKNKEPGFEMAVIGSACTLLSHIQRNYPVKEHIKDIYADSRREKMGRIMEYIAANLTERITTKELSKEFFVTESYMCQFFKSQTGQSVTEYINRLRIEKAMSFLKNTEMSITEIAMHTGFTDSCYFTRVFKKYTGLSPREYRKNMD